MANVINRVWTAVRGALETKSSELIGYDRVWALFAGEGNAKWSEASYQTAARDGYNKNVIVYQCVDKLAQGVSSLCWYAYDKNGNELKSSKALDLLNTPNPVDTLQSLLAKLTAGYELSGNCYFELVSSGPKAPPVFMWSLRPDCMEINPGSQRLPQSYTYSNGSESYTYLVNPVTGEMRTLDGTRRLIHIKTFNPLEDYRGLSPTAPAGISIDLHNGVSEWNKKLLDNGAKPPGAFVYKDDLTQAQIDQMSSQIKSKWTGSSNAGKPLLLANGLDYKILGISPVDMDYLNSKHSSARDIALAFKVPPLLLGIPGDATYSNQAEARIALWEEAILPLAKTFAQVFNKIIVPMFNAADVIGYDEDDISALEPKRQAKWDKYSKADFLTFNEKRLALGYPEIEGGNDIYINAGMLPVGTPTDGSEVGDTYTDK